MYIRDIMIKLCSVCFFVLCWHVYLLIKITVLKMHVLPKNTMYYPINQQFCLVLSVIVLAIQYLIYNKFPQLLYSLFSRLAQRILSYYDRAILPCSGIINHCCGVVPLFSCIVPLHTLYIPRRSCVNNLNSFSARQSNGTINLNRFFSQLFRFIVPLCKTVTQLRTKIGLSSNVSPQIPIITIYKSNFLKQ